MNAIPKFRYEETSIYESPMPARERVKRAELEKQKMIANTPDDWFDLPEPVTLLKKLKETKEQALSFIPESALKSSKQTERQTRTLNTSDLLKDDVRATVIATQMPALSPELAKMKTVTPALVRERAYTPAKPEKKKVSGWRSFFGKAVNAVTETLKSTQRYGGQLAAAGIAAATLMGAVPSNGNETEVYTANNVVAVQADTTKRAVKNVQSDSRSWLKGSWAADYAKSLDIAYQQNGYPELPKVENLSVNVFEVKSDTHSGMGILQALASQSPELDKLFNQDAKLRRIAYANLWKGLDAQGWDANWLPLGTRLAMTNGTVFLMDANGKACSANLF